MHGIDEMLGSLEFFTIAERLKQIGRLNTLLDTSRPETVAEHCWHVALLALLLEPHAPPDIDQVRVRDLITIHDLVEVYAGDSNFYEAAADVPAKEAAAAHTLLAFLNGMNRQRFTSLIDEFQAQETAEARYARALDALQPMILVAYYPPGTGLGWHDGTPSHRLARKRPLLEPFPLLWELAQHLTQMAVDRGVILPD